MVRLLTPPSLEVSRALMPKINVLPTHLDGQSLIPTSDSVACEP